VVDRILVYGVTGSGKSTLAVEIGRRTGLPCHLVDELTWEPGWVEVPADVQRQRISPIVATDRWVMDSAYGKWLELPLQRAELIVALDYPRWFSLARLVRRTTRRVITKETACNGNVETLFKALGKDSIIRWHFQSFARKRTRIYSWATDPDVPEVLILRSQRETDRWLAQLG
jgi:adenylate kinase family enzyme